MSRDSMFQGVEFSGVADRAGGAGLGVADFVLSDVAQDGVGGYHRRVVGRVVNGDQAG